MEGYEGGSAEQRTSKANLVLTTLKECLKQRVVDDTLGHETPITPQHVVTSIQSLSPEECQGLMEDILLGKYDSAYRPNPEISSSKEFWRLGHAIGTFLFHHGLSWKEVDCTEQEGSLIFNGGEIFFDNGETSNHLASLIKRISNQGIEEYYKHYIERRVAMARERKRFENMFLAYFLKNTDWRSLLGSDKSEDREHLRNALLRHLISDSNPKEVLTGDHICGMTMHKLCYGLMIDGSDTLRTRIFIASWCWPKDVATARLVALSDQNTLNVKLQRMRRSLMNMIQGVTIKQEALKKLRDVEVDGILPLYKFLDYVFPDAIVGNVPSEQRLIVLLGKLFGDRGKDLVIFQ